MIVIAHSKWGHQGFSLVELLVALAIGALLLGILGNVLGGIMVTTRKVLAENAEQEETLASTRIVNSLIKAAMPPDPRDATSAFAGSPRELAFTATPPESMAPYGTLRVRLYSGTDESGKASLLMDAMPARQTETRQHLELKGYRLFHDISSVSFQYFDGADTAPVAREAWANNNRLPVLINVVIIRPGMRPSITMAIAPRRTVNGRCRFDLVGSMCRY